MIKHSTHIHYTDNTILSDLKILCRVFNSAVTYVCNCTVHCTLYIDYSY